MLYLRNQVVHWVNLKLDGTPGARDDAATFSDVGGDLNELRSMEPDDEFWQ